MFASVRPEFILDLRDDPFNPHKGLFLSLISDYYNSYYTEDPDSPGVSFVKMMGQIRVYLPLGKATTFALSGGVGKIYKISEEAQVPLHKKFYLGGRMSLRGFAERGVLPAEIMKQRLKRAKTEMVDIKKEWSSGGEAMVEFKGELRIPVVNNFYLGFFMDAGNIWQDPDNFDLSQLRSSTGTGLRYLTPVGPISVDFAFKLDPKKSLQEEDWMVHFSIGMF